MPTPIEHIDAVLEMLTEKDMKMRAERDRIMGHRDLDPRPFKNYLFFQKRNRIAQAIQDNEFVIEALGELREEQVRNQFEPSNGMRKGQELSVTSAGGKRK